MELINRMKIQCPCHSKSLVLHKLWNFRSCAPFKCGGESLQQNAKWVTKRCRSHFRLERRCDENTKKWMHCRWYFFKDLGTYLHSCFCFFGRWRLLYFLFRFCRKSSNNRWQWVQSRHVLRSNQRANILHLSGMSQKVVNTTQVTLRKGSAHF